MEPGDDPRWPEDAGGLPAVDVRWSEDPRQGPRGGTGAPPADAPGDAGPSTAGPPGAVARGLAAAGTVLGIVWMVLDATGLVASGYPLTAAAIVVTTIPLFVLLAAVAAAPGKLEALLRRWTTVRLGAPGELGALVLVAGTLVVILGLGSVVSAAYEWESIAAHGASLADLTQLTPTSLVENLLVNTAIFVLPPLAWIAFVNHRDLRGVLASLGLRWRPERLAASVGVGLAIAVATLLLLVGLAAAAQALGTPVPPNPRAEDIVKALSLPTAVVVALLAAVGEEVFFRGFLEPRIGLVAQAVLFSIAHLSYLNVLQLVVTLVMGLALGWARRYRGDLYAPMAAHFAFNFLQFAAVLASGSLGG